jgi:septum formation protein
MTPGRLVLASASPQRRAILSQLGIDFDVVAPDVQELSEGEPEALVIDNALRKARAVRAGDSAGGIDRPVLGADTAVVVDGEVYGKPRDEAEAEAVLRLLSGRAHEVRSGIAVVDAGGEQTAAACTVVRFRSLDEPILRWYLRSGEWRERAGGYAIQGRGAALVEGIEGDYWNVVGLPVAALLRMRPDFAFPSG